MSIKPLSSLFLALSVFLIAGCDNANNTTKTAQTSDTQTITIEHAQGKTTIPLHPSKVIVMNPETLDILDAIGAPVAGVPQTNSHLPDFLSKYKSNTYINAGTLFEPAYETLSNEQPDLILAGGRAEAAYEKLSEIAPTIAMDVDRTHFIDSLTERTKTLARLFGKEKEADKVLADFNAKIATVKAKTANVGSAMVVLISGGKISAYGTGSRFGFFYDVLGFKPAYQFDNVGTHGNIVSSELLLKLNPDWLFVIDRDKAIERSDAQPAKQILDNALVRKTNAWENDHIVYLDPTAIYISGGLQTYSHIMDTVNNALDKQ